jgi:uncharacterized protein
MKKPKKMSAAKPLSRRRTTAKPDAKTLKTGAADTPEKTPKLRKQTARAPEPTAPEEVKPAAKAEPPAKTKSKVKTKLTAAKTPESKLEVKPPAKPDLESKPAKAKKSRVPKTAPETPPEVKPESKPVLKAETVAKAKSTTAAKPESKAKVKIHAKPAAKAKSLVAKKTASKELSETKPASEAEPTAKENQVVEVEFVVEVTPKARAKPNGNAKSIATAKSDGEAKAPVAPNPAPETKPPVAKPAGAPPESKRPPRAARKAPAKIPPILLEGDKPQAAPVSGPGQRYALGPKPPVEKLQTEGELPESYGTGEILLAARDPHWLYTHWDLPSEQQRRYNGFSRDGHLVLRIHVDQPGGKPVAQVHLHPESRHWFVHVDRANTRYVAELGYYSAADKWTVVATSAATLTPPDAVSTETAAEFGTIPFEVPMEKLLSLVKEAVHENAPLAQAMQELRAEGHAELPRIDVPSPAPESKPAPTRERRRLAGTPSAGQKAPPARWTPSEWTPAQERALAEVVSMDHVRRVLMGSLEITELIRRQFIHELASMSAAEISAIAPGAPTSPSGAVTGISSPGAKAERQPKGFWFNVNAELIVYGATEKNATVSIGGRKIKLRPDGSFSYRFALPDGNYEMPIVAISADLTDGRAAEMKFSRSTEYRGDVGAHPQDPSLQQLLLENF